MKKFSNVSGSDIPKNPKPISIENDPIEDIKLKIINLIDNNLKIMSYGSARINILPSVKIAGREDLADAIVDLLSQYEIKEQIKILESLKITNHDWKSIDDQIQNLNEKFKNINQGNKYKCHISKIQNLIGLCDGDIDYSEIIEHYVNKISDKNLLQSRIEAIGILMESNSDEILLKILESHHNRLNQIK